MDPYPNGSSPPLGGPRHQPHSREPPHTPHRSGFPRLPMTSEDGGEGQLLRRPLPLGALGFSEDGYTPGAENRSPLAHSGFINRTERTGQVPEQDQGPYSTMEDSSPPRQPTSSSYGRSPADNLTPGTPYNLHHPGFNHHFFQQAQSGSSTISTRDLYVTGIEANRSASTSSDLIPLDNIDADVGVTGGVSSTEEAFIYHGKSPFTPDPTTPQYHWPGMTDGGHGPHTNLPNAELLSPHRYHQGRGADSEAGASTATSSRSGRLIRRSPRRYYCNDCGGSRPSFGSRKDLTRHQNSVHSQERKYTCDNCSYRTARKDNCDRHKRTCTAPAQNGDDYDNDGDGHEDQHDTRDLYHITDHLPRDQYLSQHPYYAQDSYHTQDPYPTLDSYHIQDPYHAQDPHRIPDQYDQDQPRGPYQPQDQDEIERTGLLLPYSTPPHFKSDDLSSSYD